MSTEQANTGEGKETAAESNPTYGKTAIFNAFALGVFAVGTALILGFTYTGTKDRIAESQRIAEEKALLEVIGNTRFDNDLLEDLISLEKSQTSPLNLPLESHARVVRLNDKIQGFILPATAPDGYSGNIHMLVGIAVDGSLMGVRVVDHKETPGLGDKVDTKKSDWILGFAGKSLANPEKDKWAVKKDGGDFDAFTGATITPRAVVKTIKAALEIGETDMQILIESARDKELGKNTGPEVTNDD